MLLTWQQNFKLLWFVTVHYLYLFQITLKGKPVHSDDMGAWVQVHNSLPYAVQCKETMKETVTHL